jgi:hypothetical protein
MLDSPSSHPLKRFFINMRDQSKPSENETISDIKVLPIKPPSPRRSLRRYFSYSQLLLIPILTAGTYFFAIARDRYITRSDFVIRKAEDAANSDGNSLGSLLGRSNQLSFEDA